KKAVSIYKVGAVQGRTTGARDPAMSGGHRCRGGGGAGAGPGSNSGGIGSTRRGVVGSSWPGGQPRARSRARLSAYSGDPAAGQPRAAAVGLEFERRNAAGWALDVAWAQAYFWR